MSHDITRNADGSYRCLYAMEHLDGSVKRPWHASWTMQSDTQQMVARFSGREFVDRMRALKILAVSIAKEGQKTTETNTIIPTHTVGAKYANVATYDDGTTGYLGTVGEVYQPSDMDVLASVVVAITDDLGLLPTSAFTIGNLGSGLCIVWELLDRDGKQCYFMLLESFDGSRHLTAGYTITDAVCANTIAVALMQSGEACAKLHHSSDLNAQLAAMPALVERAREECKGLVDVYADYGDVDLTEPQLESFLDRMLPDSVAVDADGNARKASAQALNKREQIRIAAGLEVNSYGGPYNLRRWVNAANYSVDRNAAKPADPMRAGASTPRKAAESMLFGSHGSAINDVLTQTDELLKIIVLQADGTEEAVSVRAAIAQGVDPGQVGSALLDAVIDAS